MTVKEMLDNYAAEKNTLTKIYTNEQFIGKAASEGVRIGWDAEGNDVIARIKRDKSAIWIEETTVIETLKGIEKITVEVARANY